MSSGPKPGAWRIHWQCVQCRLHGRSQDMGSVCPSCGHLTLRSISARPMRYRWLHRLALLLAGHPQPRNFWETGPL